MHLFFPFAFETLGPTNHAGCRISAVTEDSCEHLSVTLQHFNAISLTLLTTKPSHSTEAIYLNFSDFRNWVLRVINNNNKTTSQKFYRLTAISCINVSIGKHVLNVQQINYFSN
jgi:hypothetical protein